MIAAHGRITPARVRVLDALLSSPCALSHQDLEQRLGGTIDRVTLYRVLDWLLAKGLVHRIAGDDRVWHFSASGRVEDAHEHAHFHCRDCGRWYCLDAVQPVYALSLPPGFRVELGKLTLSGLCPACTARNGSRA
ncbi:MAG: Fur family transcriptional regulator [Thiobacillaceae bacterium]